MWGIIAKYLLSYTRTKYCTPYSVMESRAVCCLVFHREQSVSSAELRQASVKSPAKGELSLAYALLAEENQTKKRALFLPGYRGMGICSI